MYLNTTAVDIQFSHGIDFERDLFQKTYPIVKSFQIARPPSEEKELLKQSMCVSCSEMTDFFPTMDHHLHLIICLC